MEYMRDENGEVYGFIYDGSTYFLEKNALGDVMYLLNGNGAVVAQYTYDEWGKVVSVVDANGNDITDLANVAHLNPFRYRSYYYDWETGLYYLNSRYYDPETCRFVNADSRLNSGSAISFNLFAYCENNPIVNVDPDGHFAVSATTIAVGLSVALKLLVTVVVAVVVVEATKAIINNTVDIIDTARTRREFRQRDDTKEDEKDSAIPSQPESPEYYGADTYGGTWKKVTPAMTYEEAIDWVELTAATDVYGKNASWGLYTTSKSKAENMATVLGGGAIPEFHLGEAGQYPHYHVYGFNLYNKYKHFHVWYGIIN